MCKKKIVLLILCCVASHAAVGKQMYKTVGPDGKITFSAYPPGDGKSKVSELKSYGMRPVEAPPNRSGPVQAAPPRKPAPVGQATAALTPEIEDAIVTVMGLAEFGRRFEAFCNTSDAAAKAFASANNGWKKRNLAAIEQQKRLLTEVVSPARRAHLLDMHQQLAADEVAKVTALAPAARKEWCAGVVDEFNSGTGDVNQPAMMAVPIVPYRAK
jgi:hypothetical protein